MLEILTHKFVAQTTEDGDRDVEMQNLYITDDCGSTMARIAWRLDTGEVMQLWVRESERRKGIATRLWHEARALGAKHSPWRTQEGELWALSLGEELPPLHQA